MTEIGANRLCVAVNDLFDQAQLVEGLVPELSLRLGCEDALARPWQRRREDERTHALGELSSHRPQPTRPAVPEQARLIPGRDSVETDARRTGQPDRRMRHP